MGRAVGSYPAIQAERQGSGIAMNAIILSACAKSPGTDSRTATTTRHNAKTVATGNFTEDIFSQWTTAREHVRITCYKQKPPQRCKRYGGLVPG
jgi:hypothetical protein